MNSLAFTLALALLVACPVAADEAAVTIAGRVTVNGKLLVNGMINFHLDDNEFVGSKVKGGNYKVTRVPAGTWRVTVESDEDASKFALEDTTPLTVDVKQGMNTMDFDLPRK